MANSHLVILKRPYLQAILSGRKSIESRFMKIKRVPYAKVSAGDRLFFKESGGKVCGTGKAGKVMQFKGLTDQRIIQLKRKYNQRICGADSYWEQQKDCRWGVLVWLKEVRAIEPIRIDKKDWRGWAVLTKGRDFGLLTEQTRPVIC
jgi:ASC-1-like (ASCH) protein